MEGTWPLSRDEHRRPSRGGAANPQSREMDREWMDEKHFECIGSKSPSRGYSASGVATSSAEDGMGPNGWQRSPQGKRRRMTETKDDDEDGIESESGAVQPRQGRYFYDESTAPATSRSSFGLVGYNVANMGENSVPSATPQLRVDCPRVDPLHDDSALTPSQTMRKCCDDFSPEEMTASMVAEGMRRAHAGTHTVNIDAQAPSPYSGDASALWSGGQPAGHTVPVAVPRHPRQGCLNPHIGLSESPASIGSGAGSIGSLSRGLSPLREDMKGMVL